MYSASAAFLTAIKSNIRVFHWSGTISTPTPITFGDSDIIEGNIIRSIAGESLEIGSVYSSQLSLEVKLPVSRYELYGCEIALSVQLDGALDVIPMGTYIITEALQSVGAIKITAFDSMIKFDDVPFSASLNNSIQSPFGWLMDACTECGVTLGSTITDIESLANGRRQTGFADSVSDVRMWRDVLGYLGAYLGAYAYIGRDGFLYMGQYGSVSADTVPASYRFDSQLSDFRTTYDGLYATYKDGGVQEYVYNTNSGGIVLNLGVNPFLQFSDTSNRIDALQEIIDSWDGVYYVPYSSNMPLIPIYDVGDVLTFIDNQAGVYDLGAITEITYNIGGSMNVICSGDNPRLAEAQDRFSKTLQGLSSEYSNGQEIGKQGFWLLHTENALPITVNSTKTQVAEIEFDQKTDFQKIGFMYDCDGSLSATAVIVVEINVDDEFVYTHEITDRRLAGKVPFPANCGFTVQGKGTHTAKVYMTVTDSPLLWGELK